MRGVRVVLQLAVHHEGEFEREGADRGRRHLDLEEGHKEQRLGSLVTKRQSEKRSEIEVWSLDDEEEGVF